MGEVKTQNSIKSNSADSGSIKKDNVRAEDVIPKITQPSASGETVKKDSVKVNVSLSLFLSYFSDFLDYQ